MSNELVKLDQLPDWMTGALKAFEGKPANLLLPAVPVNSTLGFGHRPMVSVVHVDANPDAGEIYKVGGRYDGDGEHRKWWNTYALGKPALDRIASAAGISFQTQRVDDRKDPARCEIECRAAMKNESGVWVVKTYRKEISMVDVMDARRVEKQAANAKAPQKDRKTDAVLEAELRAEMANYRKHMAARCETGAVLRAVRGQLGIKAQWTLPELARPFIVLRVDFQPDASDPMAKRFLLEAGSRSSEALFGAVSAARAVQGEVVVEVGAESTTHADLPVGDEVHEPAPPKVTLDQLLALPQSEKTEYVKRGIELMGVDPTAYMQLAERCGFDVDKMVTEVNRMAEEGGVA